MVDVLGSISAADQLIDTGIKVVGRLRRAYTNLKEQEGILDRHAQNLAGTRELLDIIRAHECLQTTIVKAEVCRLTEVAELLQGWLDKHELRDKTALRRFVSHFFKGSEAEKELDNIMQQLARANVSLCLHVQVAGIGVIQTLGDTVVANSDTINRVDQRLELLLGRGKGLKIAQLVRGKSADRNGLVTLNRTDVESMSGDDHSFRDGSDSGIGLSRSSNETFGRKRIIRNNETQDDGLLVAGPIEEDLYSHVDSVEVHDNKAAGRSIMVAYAIKRNDWREIMEQRRLGLSMQSKGTPHC